MNYAVNVLLFLIVTSQYIEELEGSKPPVNARNKPKANRQTSAKPGRQVQARPVVDPCAPYNPPKPNFGRQNRISEAKCMEHIWTVKTQMERAEKEKGCTTKKSNQFHIFVIGGQVASPGQYPHMGAVGWRAVIGTWIFRCGSTLISSKFMLTAAHCSASSSDSNVANPIPEIVRLGDKNIIDKFSNGIIPNDARIRKIINHPQYSSPKRYFDIAIIELVSEVYFSRNIQPACLWSKFDTSKLGRKATITGWGVVETASKKSSPDLRAATVDLINSTYCDRLLRPARNRLWWGMERHQLCSGKLAGGVDACRGDSGGPLQVKIKLPFKTELSLHYIIGVTSFGIGCARENLPGVYTRVSSFLDWIEKIVWRK